MTPSEDAILTIQKIESDDLTPGLYQKVMNLCNRAYEENFEGLFQTFGKATHLLGWLGSNLVTHLMWVTRYLEPVGIRTLETAYLEMVATAPDHRGQGYATALLERVPEGVVSFDLAALCPAVDGIYERLGWRYWRGELFIRQAGGLVPTPEERIMVLELPHTPPLDYAAAISAEWREGEVW
jgi:GNAT superfamily N-acetyltransferase